MARLANRTFRDKSRGYAFRAAWVVCVVALLAGGTGVRAASAEDAVTVAVNTEAAYMRESSDADMLNRRLALFRACRQAADEAAGVFENRRLIQFADRDRDELVLLVADRLEGADIHEDCRAVNGRNVCRVQVRSRVRLSDFIEAELASIQLRADEVKADYHDEMEPALPSLLRPGHFLARAFRLMDLNEPRPAIIYLDKLARRYPGWRELYEAKALALGMQNRADEALAALRKACDLGSPLACDTLEADAERERRAGEE